MTDKHVTKVSLSDIAALEQLIDQAPARQATEVSKQQAIGRLAPKLRAMRGKGYAWSDVAAWLTDHGLPVTAPALQRYLRAVKLPDARVHAGRAIGSRGNASRGAKAPSRSPSPAPVVHPAQTPRRDASPAPPTVPGALPPKAQAPEPQRRRTEFVPRPDSEDI